MMVKECLQKAVVLYAGLESEILSYTQDQQNIGIMYVVHYTEMLKRLAIFTCYSQHFVPVKYERYEMDNMEKIRLTYNVYNNTKYSKDIIERISRV